MEPHMANERYDLHSHTQASDGMNKPAENVRLAKEKGLTGLAITDHDTVAGIEEALLAGKELGVDVVPGIEISTRAGGKDIHVLGYFLNFEDEHLLERLARLRSVREERNTLIIAKLQQLGLEITMEEVKAGVARPLRPGESLGRPHIADVLVRKGYVSDMREAFDRYLSEGKPGYASLPRISPEEAITWIHEGGGAAVLAHPGLYGDDELVRSILERGKPDGIEVYHSDHGAEEEIRYAAMAEQYGLIVTEGSDYHGVRQGVVFHGDLGGRTAPPGTVERLKQAAEAARRAEKN
ncbi:PHP domain protein [Paenibacillus sp. oral taxon 786 str. D14]|uniref:PHP domain-containing protein n=1 Tax=Paenibacillus sp. oral taxon 786 TaxID=652715 RepID=UPI0001AFD571|nr:PHP domain-containing protein [Paenibacillus sp. oral taxon 786]EES72821.1 PHP domain protein [Paenibacillus sp. oral taxon 786 str. D14]